MLKWTTFFHVGFPLLLGSLFLAAPSALIFYFVLLAILKAREARG
jgi:ABC-type sugar transport system permease subunit